MMNCYLNGEFMPVEEARVSVLDRGFLFGDGAYEVVPVYDGGMFCWDRHLRRLRESLDAIRLPFSVAELTAPAKRLVAGGGDASLYIQITRGAAATRRHAPPAEVSPTVFLMRSPRPPVADSEGLCCLTADDFRWRRGDIKSVSLLAAVMLSDSAAARGADEVVLLRDGVLTEGASCNYVVVCGRELLTPVADSRILSGITYQTILETARECGYATTARDIERAELFGAAEIWLTSSLREMQPVTSLDDHPIGEGKPGPALLEIRAAWRAKIADYCRDSGGE